MIYPIVAYGHPVLKKKAKEIDKDYPDLKEFLENMFETMYETVGVGLAAPQVNKSIRIFVIDASPYVEEYPEAENFKQVFINPKIVEESGDDEDFKESCLSLPFLSEYVTRKKDIRIQYYDENFEFHEEEFTGILSRVIQHEYDHLEGMVYIDRLSSFTKTLMRRKLKDLEKGNVNPPYKMIFAPSKKRR